MQKTYTIVNPDDGSVVGQLQIELPDVETPQPPATETLTCTDDNVRIRAGAGVTFGIVGHAQKGDVLVVELTRVAADGYQWAKLAEGQYAGNYIADQFLKPIDPLPEVPDPSPEPEPPASVAPPPLEGSMKLVEIVEGGEIFIELAVDGGKSRPNIGMNTREMATYWNRPVSSHPDATIPRWPTYAVNAKEMGVKWFRLFATHEDLSMNQTLEQLKSALDALAGQGHRALVCFMDAHGITGHHPESLSDYFLEDDTGKLNKAFYYEREVWEDYLLAIRAIVETFADHPALGAWQLINEPDIRPQPATQKDSSRMVEFFKWATEAVWELDKKHPIFLGLESSLAAAPTEPYLNPVALQKFAYDFYAQLPLAHVSFHAYQPTNAIYPQDAWYGEANALRDIKAAKHHKRLCWCDEFGSFYGNRAEAEELFLLRIQLGHSVELALRWAYMDEEQDAGNGDAAWGFDPVLPHNRDWFYPLRDRFHHWNVSVLPR